MELFRILADRKRLKGVLSSCWAERIIIGVIVANALVLGLEAIPAARERLYGILTLLDTFFLWFFTVEILLRLHAHRLAFFRDPWSIFDFMVVAVAWLPSSGAFAALRALRVLRVLRLISTVKSMRRVVSGLLQAIPGVGSIMLLMALVFYVFSVMATLLYGEAFPEWFGHLGRSAYTLFQVMTLESWSMGIVRPVMEKFPLAWAFFVPFILVTSFTVLNLFIGIIVNAMQMDFEDAIREEQQHQEEKLDALLDELRTLRQEVAQLRAAGKVDQISAQHPPGAQEQ